METLNPEEYINCYKEIANLHLKYSDETMLTVIITIYLKSLRYHGYDLKRILNVVAQSYMLLDHEEAKLQ